jgi:GTP-binding protein Era
MEYLHKSGFVAVMGRPNVGKSTLVNALLGQKVAAVSPRPQTTRRQQLGILSLENAQAIFVDTPGVHHPRHKLGESMNQSAQEALEDCDLVLFMVDASQEPSEDDRLLADRLGTLKRTPPLILALNKIDLLSLDVQPMRLVDYERLLPARYASPEHHKSLCVSATRGDNRQALLDEILERLPENPPFFPEDQVTDLFERDIAGDLIREAALSHLREEIPHGINVRVDEFTERSDQGAFIAATIFVEKESHKPIVIGQGGSMLKKIGTAARQEIEAMSGRKVFLQLRVKVRKNWRDDEKALKQFGFSSKSRKG